MTTSWTLLKLGGELLENRAAVSQASDVIARLTALGPLVVVHGGGRDIDAECSRRQLAKQAVDGLRITDEPVLDAVVAALAGTVNTRLVAALVARGVSAVGLTGADAALGLATKAPSYTSTTGLQVDLGLVGIPSRDASPRLVVDLVDRGYVPVIATLGVSASGEILNVNADVLASHLAAQLGVGRLLIAGGTAGVLDADGQTIAALDQAGAAEMKRTGTASVGMVAKLDAAFDALRQGVPDVRIVSGNQGDLALAPVGTQLVAATAIGKESSR